MNRTTARWVRWGLPALLAATAWTAWGSCAGGSSTLDSAAAASPAVEARRQPADAVAPLEAKPMRETQWTGTRGPAWKEYDRLVGEQKLEEASKVVEKILADAKAAGNGEEQTRALVTWTTLRIGLHGYETAVRWLKEQPWPDDLVSRVVLDLYYANALRTYAQAYSWEIQRRERVESKAAVDLKAWTMEQIHAEAIRAATDAWLVRAQLGKQPVRSLLEYIDPNDFPAQVRPTLRDAVTYMLVAWLQDTSGWNPRQSNELFLLDLGTLLADAQPIAVDPSDGKVHPLVRAVAVLSDLEAWHAGRSEPEAALEARLERLEMLHGQFAEAPDRERIRNDLRTRLPAFRKWPWWAMGVARLADFTRQEDAPDAQVQARKIAQEGLEAYPDAAGGHACLSVVKSIEAREFQLQAMGSDGPGRRSLGITYRNLRRLHFRAYPMDLFRWLESSNDYNFLPSWDDLQRAGARVAAEWAEDLPETTDYRQHKAWSIPPVKTPGLYIVIASAEADFRQADNVITGAAMIVGDPVLLTNIQQEDVEVRVVSGSTGAPLAGVEVFLYRFDWRTRHKVVTRSKSGADGRTTFKVPQGEMHFVAARRGAELAVDPQWIHTWRAGAPVDQPRALIFTDRSIFRPNQKILWKTVVFHGLEGRLAASPNAPVTVRLVDANGQVVEEKTLTTNRFGSASGEFAIPGGRLLGQWTLQSTPQGHAQVRVEEYKRPTFEAKVLDPKDPMRLNREATVKGEVKYYFGLPVTAGGVKWRVNREPVYPWWWGWWWGGMPQARTQVVASGTTALGPDGTFTFRFTPVADERQAGADQSVTWRYAITADVTDEGGETRTASRSFRLGFTAVEATLASDSGFVREDQPSEVTITRTDLDGTPQPGAGTWSLVRVNAPVQTLLPADQPLPVAPGDTSLKLAGDRLRPRWDPGYRPDAVMRSWPDGDEKAQGKVDHDAKGRAVAKLPPLDPGAWRLRYRTTDAFGAKYETFKDFVVAGREARLPLPAFLAVEKPSVPVGGTARVLVASGTQGQPMELVVWRDGKVAERRPWIAGRDPSVIEFPVRESDRGGFSVGLHAVRDHQWMQFTGSIFVPWDDKELKVEFRTFRDKMQPGAHETWTVKVSGPSGKDIAVRAAEVLAYMYDRSLDLFAPHTPPSVAGLYPGRGSTGWVRASLGVARGIWVPCSGFNPVPTWPSFEVDRLKFQASYGIGGPGVRGWGRGGGGGRYRMAMPSAMPAPAPASAAKVAMDAVAEEAPAGLVMKKGEVAAGAKDADRRGGEPAQAPAPGPAAPAPEVQLRSDFSETAFWTPHLVTADDGTASLEFTVPDSVTSWNVWVHAITADMKGGSLHQEARSVKDLMVRPYLPRFLREGDEADLKVVVNNASEAEMKGTLTFDILDPTTQKSLLADFGLKPEAARDQRFTVAPGAGTNLSFPIKVPARVGSVAFKVTAVSGNVGDGELRPVPVLPGRMHLAQSRFVTLKGKQARQMTFADLARNDDPSLLSEQMVVTVDAQLFYSVLSAVPYLVNYPYECTEQTLNRFLSTGILTSMFRKYPAVERMATEFAKRKTMFETFDAPDPNRKMALEETPWVVESKGGGVEESDLVNVLDPRIAAANRAGALDKLRKSQTSSGGFPWFPGGPPSPYMTLYLLYGFSKAMEFGVEVPEDMLRRAWAYVHQHYLDEVVRDMMGHDCCWEFITFLNFTISAYKDPSWTSFSIEERRTMLDFSFRHWKQHAPYVKGQLALTLNRMDRAKDARLVWESVMDSAKEAEDQGVFWAPEDRGWLWYNDTIETHAFAIRVLMELMPQDTHLDGLVLWIFLNKKLNHWKSTRATAEVVYSLAKYLDSVGQMGAREEATVDIGGQRTTWVFEPDKYTGKKNQIVIPGEKVDPATTSTIKVEKTTPGYLFASATWHFSTERMPAEDRGDFLSVSRTFFRRDTSGGEARLQPLAEGAAISVGDQLEVQVSLRAKHAMEYVHLRDPRGAGFEPEGAVSRHRWDLGIYWYEEIRDSGTNFFFEHLPQGEYTFKYRVRAATAGTFKVAPATVQPMYAPEFTAYSAGKVIRIDPGK